MLIGNCSQVGGCPQAIRVTTANSQPVIFNSQTQSYVVDPQNKSPDQQWDLGVIAKNVALWTLGIGTAALIGLRTLGATKKS